MQHQVLIDTDQCVGCGLCAADCVAHNIKVKDGKAATILDRCVLCGHCVAVCPQKAVSISGYEEAPVEKKSFPRLDPAAVLETIRFRRSIRQFKTQSIPDEVLRQILEAGRLTHTAENLQDVSFVVLEKQKDAIEQLAVRLFRRVKPLADLFSPLAKNNRIDDHFFFFHAPAVIVILAKDKTNGLLAAQNMEFAAEANGLGVLYSGYFTMAANASRKIKKALHIPKGKKAAATLVLGYPNVTYFRAPPRKKLDVRYL